MSIYVTSLTLQLSFRTLETFYFLGISTHWTSIFSLMCLFRIKFPLVGSHLLVVFTCISLVTLWSWLERLLFPLALAWWEVHSLMSYQIDWGHLGVTCNLFDVMCFSLWCLHLLCKLPDFACRKLLQMYTAIIYGFGHTLFIFHKEPEYIFMQDTCCFWWVMGKRHLCLYWIVPLIYRWISLSEVCKQAISGSDFIHLWLAEIFILGPSSVDKHQETYLSIPKYPLHAMTFLLFFDSVNIASSRMYGTSHHPLSNPSWDHLYKAWTSVAQIVFDL